MKRSLQQEMMDHAGNPADLLEGDLANLRLLNRLLGGHRAVLTGLGRLVGRREASGLSLLDVGTGSADIPAAIVRWARRRRLCVRVVAVEADPVAAAAARRLTRNLPEISVVRGDARNLPFRPTSFDFVLCSQLLHHFSEGEIPLLLRNWSSLARRAILVSDLVRHPLAYFGIRLLTLLFTRNQMTRVDAPLSVHRSFTIPEWSELLRRAAIGELRLSPVFPFRLLALFPLRG